MRAAYILIALILALGAFMVFYPVDPGPRGAIIGTWQSIDDAKFTREFRNDGTVIDRYEGGEGEEARWMLFTSDMPPEGFVGELEAGATYLTIEGDSPPLRFRLERIDETTLEILYLDRGNTLRFQKI